MNKRNDVIKHIRKTLNHLMVINKGCQFKLKPNSNRGVFEVLSYYQGVVYYGAISSGNYNIEKLSKYQIEDIEIIGKEPTILDALNCLSKINENFSLGDDGSLLENSSYIYFKNSNNGNFLKFDFLKPLVKDLDDKIIEYLHKVLC